MSNSFLKRVSVLGLAAAGVCGLILVWRRTQKRPANIDEKETTAKDYKIQTRSRFRTGQDKARVICCRSVSEYSACVNETICPEDRVLLVNATENEDRISVDIKKKTDNVTMFRGKDVWDVKYLQTIGHVSVICINYTDALGNFLLCDIVAVIRLLRNVFEPHLQYIIVKDKGLGRHADSYMPFDVFTHEHHRRLESGLERSLVHRRDPTVICAVGVVEYRMAIPLIIETGDRVLEIGCARGTTIAMASKHIGSPADGGVCVGIDMGKVCIENSRKDHEQLLEKSSHVSFEVGNGWDVSGLLKLSPYFNVIFVDIGGISGSDGEFEGISFIRQLMCVFNSTNSSEQLRYIVVKSRCLRDHAISYVSAGRFRNKEQRTQQRE